MTVLKFLGTVDYVDKNGAFEQDPSLGNSVGFLLDTYCRFFGNGVKKSTKACVCTKVSMRKLSNIN